MNNQNKHLENLLKLLRIQTISTQPKHHKDILEAVSFLEQQLQTIGFQKIERKWAKGCEDMPPIIFAERVDNPDNPTLLVYNHYDVQPADPLEEWKKPPFEPVIENGNIYGRGTTDDKGQLMTHLAALSELSEEWGETWPINIKIIYEGQE
ncbi:MAG TPA: M20/M25/M40 family metallo-hydrolase [Candidatus Saccharimonadales bacterium]|nr:M20/M25/M40 family metallo-hydrolase [Candidatus Saccharimonadales bacterium]